MANGFDQDNWDEKPKYDGSNSTGNYKQYKAPEGGGSGGPGFQPPRQDTDGATSRTLGIIGIFVTLCCCQIAGIVLGIIGYGKAKRSAQNLGYETSDAATGRVLGIVNIVLGILSIVGSVVTLVLSGTMTALLAGEGLEAFSTTTASLALFNL